MGETSISWTNSSWNPLIAFNVETGARGHFCVHRSSGCDHCYSETINKSGFQIGTKVAFLAQNRDNVRLELHQPTLVKPLQWGKAQMIFVCSMTDLFLEDYPDEWIDQVFAVMLLAPKHAFQVLTKRAKRMRDYLNTPDRPARIVAAMAKVIDPILTDRNASAWDSTLETFETMGLKTWPIQNVWCGVSAEDQKNATERIPFLMDTPAAIRWVSYEPALSAVDFDLSYPCPSCDGAGGGTDFSAVSLDDGAWDCDRCEGTGRIPFKHIPNWIVIGGESGPNARPFDITWARDTVRQCQQAGVAVFVKQMGSKPFIGTGDSDHSWYDGKNFRDGCLGLKLKHPKGEDPSEWPEDLRVREYPANALQDAVLL